MNYNNRAITKFNDFKVHLPIEHSSIYIIPNNYHKLPFMNVNHTQYNLKFKFLRTKQIRTNIKCTTLNQHETQYRREIRLNLVETTIQTIMIQT
jgi:hypothetical protein